MHCVGLCLSFLCHIHVPCASAVGGVQADNWRLFVEFIRSMDDVYSDCKCHSSSPNASWRSEDPPGKSHGDFRHALVA